MEGKWIQIKERELTEEEKEFYKHPKFAVEFIFDCPLPEDNTEVLITTWLREVRMTTFYNDEYGAYFEQYEDRGDVLAWMPLPEPFKEEESYEK